MTVPSATDDLLHSILATEEQLRRERDAGGATYRARVRLAEAFRAEGAIRQFTLAFDEPEAIEWP